MGMGRVLALGSLTQRLTVCNYQALSGSCTQLFPSLPHFTPPARAGPYLPAMSSPALFYECFCNNSWMCCCSTGAGPNKASATAPAILMRSGLRVGDPKGWQATLFCGDDCDEC